MALNLSKRTRYIMGLILFIPLILSFLVWGIGDMIKASGSARYAAMVGNTTISTGEFQRAYTQQVEGMRRQGMNITSEMAKSLGIGRSVLQNMIQRELLLQGAKDMGIVVSDKMAAAEIQKERAFYDDTGKFSSEKFKELLQNAGVSENEFVAGLRGDLSIRMLLGALQSAAFPPAELARQMYVLQNTKYTADVYALAHADVQGIGNPNDAELKAFYDAHQDKYQRPELRKMTMAVLSVKDWERGQQPSEAELDALYKSRIADFSEPEERSVQFVVLPDEAKARSVAERARAGDKLSAVATEVSGAPVELKKMESVKQGTLPANLDGAIFKLPRAETSEPVKTPLGWYVMQITNIKTGLTPPIGKVKDKLITAWKADRASESLPKVLNELDDGIAGGASLEELAKTYHLQLRQLPLMSADGKGADKNISADESLQSAIAAGFKQNQGEIGNVFEMPGGDYAVVRVDDVRPAAVVPLGEIRQQLATEWRNQNARQIAEKGAHELANALRSNGDASVIAKKIGAKFSTRTDIHRENERQLDAIDRAIMRAAARGDVVTAADKATEYVARIQSMSAPNAAAITPANLTQMQTLASEWVKSDYLQIFLNALEKAHKVEVNEKALNQIQ